MVWLAGVRKGLWYAPVAIVLIPGNSICLYLYEMDDRRLERASEVVLLKLLMKVSGECLLLRSQSCHAIFLQSYAGSEHEGDGDVRQARRCKFGPSWR